MSLEFIPHLVVVELLLQKKDDTAVDFLKLLLINHVGRYIYLILVVRDLIIVLVKPSFEVTIKLFRNGVLGNGLAGRNNLFFGDDAVHVVAGREKT